MVPLMLQMVSPELRQPPVNALRVSLHPTGLAPMIENLAAWRAHSLARVRRQAHESGDPRMAALLAELQSYPGPIASEGEPPYGIDDVIVPIVINSPLGRFEFITTITVFGAPHDVTLAELAVETLLPADRATADKLQQLLDSAEAVVT
jgi:hypothetical protein